MYKNYEVIVLAKRKKRNVAAWVFGVFAAVALVAVVSMLFGQGVLGSWKVPLAPGREKPWVDTAVTKTVSPTGTISPQPATCAPIACVISSEPGKEPTAKCISMTDAEALATCRRLWGLS